MPPPPQTSAKLCDAAKPAKKPLPQASAISRKSGAVVKAKRFTCSDCNLGVTFKSKLDLQHHQSGKQSCHRTAFLGVSIFLKGCLRPGVDVMFTIFCDFCLFSAKNWRFSQKPML
jgi:hypothetical protein